MEVSSVLGRPGSYVGWSIYGCVLGSVLAVLEWRYWAEGRLGGVGIVARGRVEAVTAGSDCWAGCGGLYKLGCHSSLALVNKEGEASGACSDRACADRACAGEACADGACADGACAGGACVDGACTDEACTGGVCVGRAYADGACTDGACGSGACADRVCVSRACAGGACGDGACTGGACRDGAVVIFG